MTNLDLMRSMNMIVLVISFFAMMLVAIILIVLAIWGGNEE